MRKLYHLIIEDPKGNRYEVIHYAQSFHRMPKGHKLIGVCGYHEVPKK